MNKVVYRSHTNGCTPQVTVGEDCVYFDFYFDKYLFKRYKLYANIVDGDGEAFFDFSVVEFYKNRLESTGCYEFIIKAVSDGGILLVLGDNKIFIAGYNHHNYYASDIELIVEHTKFKEDGSTESIGVVKIDCKDHTAYPGH